MGWVYPPPVWAGERVKGSREEEGNGKEREGKGRKNERRCFSC